MRYLQVGCLLVTTSALATPGAAQILRRAPTPGQPVLAPTTEERSLTIARLDDAAPPANLRGTPTFNSITLTWSPAAGASGYTVLRSAGAAGPFDPLTPAAIADTQFADLGLAASTGYWYRVTAVRPDGHYGASEPLAVTTAAGTSLERQQAVELTTTTLRVPTLPMRLPPASVTPVNPAGLIAKQTGNGQVELTWQPIEGASYYLLKGPGLPGGEVKVAGATSFTVTGVPTGTHEWAVGSHYEPGPVATPAAEFPRVRLATDVMELSGWADLHTHPMINLAFAGKLVHGGPDVGSLLPQDLSCKGPTRAVSIEQALSDDRPSHGGWNAFSFPCGDELRKTLIHAFQQGNGALPTNNPGRGYPEFLDWPKWDDITHQKMWFEWIRRARDGGLRVMVALATNNKTLGDAVAGNGDGPSDDKASADLQLAELKAFVGRHSDFMEVALGPGDVKRIVQANKIAVVLGVEIDNIGNFNKLPAGFLAGPVGDQVIAGEIQRLYNAGVRYVHPIHVMDNAFGGTAIYQDDFNIANLREAGHFWDIECADIGDDITYTYTEVVDPLRAAGAFVKLGLDPLRRSGPGPVCPPSGAGTKSKGHRNLRGLTPQGIVAIKELMKRGMIVDIDHMSHHSAESTLEIGEQFGYPIVSGHSCIRGVAGGNAENCRTRRQLERISKLHGMFGLGSDGVHRTEWAGQYQRAMNIMGYPNVDPAKAVYRNGAISFGSDLNGLVKGPKPGGGARVVYDQSFPKSRAGSKSWDYNTDGVAHYGMLADFVADLRTAAASGSTTSQGAPLGVAGAELVNEHLNRSANYFWQMWELIETRKASVK